MLNKINISLLIYFICLALKPNLAKCEPLILTKYVKSNRIDEAKTLSLVRNLPNAPKFQSYSGYFTVDEKYSSNLFFWFIPSFKNAQTSPVVIYLEGGPGASSLFSMFSFVSLKVDEKLNVSYNPYGWHQEFSMLFIDNPVGTGFSFTNSSEGYSTNQNSVANNLYEFLQQFYTVFGEYRQNDLYITGLSYAGKYVPSFGYKLMQMSKESKINFKGIAIGNGLTDPINQMNYSELLKSLGLIDEKESKEVKKLEQNMRSEIKAKNYLKAKEYMSQLLFDPKGYGVNITGYASFYDILISAFPEHMFDVKHLIEYLNQNKTKSAIHAADIQFTVPNPMVGQKLDNDFMQSVGQNLTQLIGNYKILLFTGNFDISVGVTSINGYLENKDWKYYNQFYTANRTVWKVSTSDPEVAGYAKSFGNFTHLIVRNAGHCTLCDQPRAMLDMIKRFIYSKSFQN